MKTHDQLEKEMDEVEVEIKAILNKYNFTLEVDHVLRKILISSVQTHPNGDYSIFERDTDL